MTGIKSYKTKKYSCKRTFMAAVLSIVMFLEPPLTVYASQLSAERYVSENGTLPESDTVSENGILPEVDTVTENGIMPEGDSVSENETVSENREVSENKAMNESSGAEEPAGAASYSGYTLLEDFKIYKNAVFTGEPAYTNFREFTVEEGSDYAFDISENVVFSPGFTGSDNTYRQIESYFYMVPADDGEAEDASPKDEYRRWINRSDSDSSNSLKYPDSLYRFWGSSQFGKDKASITISGNSTVEERKLIYGSEEGANLDLRTSNGSKKYYIRPGRYRILIAVKENTDYRLYYTKPVTVTDSTDIRGAAKQGTVRAGFYDGKTGESYTAAEADKTDEYGNVRDSLVRLGSEKELYLTLDGLRLGNSSSSEGQSSISRISFSYDNDNNGDFTDLTTLWPAYEYGINGYDAGYSSDCAYFSACNPRLTDKNGMTVLEGIHLIPENETDYSKLMMNGFSYRLVVETSGGNTYVAEGVHKFTDETNPEIKTKTLEKVRPGEPYSMKLTAQAKHGGELTWESVGRGYTTSTKGGVTEVRSFMDDLPPGLLLSPDGTISGTFDPLKGPESPSGNPEDDSYIPSREELLKQKWYFLRL